jgi:hypothetical protein
MRKHRKYLPANVKRRIHMEEIDVCGRTKLKRTLKEDDEGMGTGSIWIGIDTTGEFL